MKPLSEEQLTELQELAELPGQTPSFIATIMQLDLKEFMQELANPDSDIFKAYKTGKATLAITFEKKVLQLATQGSGPAQTLTHKIMKEAELKSLRDYYG